jgi:CRP/FNR family transcriptional regulator
MNVMGQFDYSEFFEKCIQPNIDVDAHCTYYKAGEQVYAQDMEIPHAYMVKKGLLKIFRIGTKGEQHIVRLVKEGHLIGFHSLLSDEPEVTGCESLTESVVCLIPGYLLKKAISQDTKVAETIMKQTCEELKQTCNSVLELSQKTVRGRLANLLLKLQALFQLKQEEPIPLVLSRMDMARWIGTSQESVSRMINEFKTDGVIDFTKSEIRILDKVKLERIIMLS